MTPTTIAVLGLVCVFALIFLEVPVGLAMAFCGIVGFAALNGSWEPALALVSTEVTNNLTSAELAVIPLFVLMGGLASAAGISTDLYRAAAACVGHRRGGMAMATIAASAGFGSICHSSIATVAAFGRIAVPEMRARGYSVEVSTGTVAAGATLASLIPPSIIMVIYAAITGVFVIDLFRASLAPLLLAITLHFLTVIIVARIRPLESPVSEKAPLAERLAMIKRAGTSVVIVVIVLGGIYGGVFTVQEGGAIGVILALVVALYRRALSVSSLTKILWEAANTTAVLYLMIIGAMIFSYFMAISHAPEALVKAIASSGMPHAGILFLLMVMYLILGAIFDEVAAMIITMPFVMPLIVSMGGNLVWWGVVNLTIIGLGMIIPPLGITVFVLQSVCREYAISTIYRGVTPFIIADLTRLALLVSFPVISLFSLKLPGA